MTAKLHEFINQAREKGLDYPTIRFLLESAGWKSKEVAEAICSKELDVPLPSPYQADNARDTFLHLLAFTALHVWTIALVALLFDLINLWLPENRVWYDDKEFIYTSIRWELACILIAFPLFVWLWRFLLREIQLHPEKAHSVVRRWLTYLTLFVGAVTVLFDGVALVFRLLEGDLTLRFLLKVAVLFVVAGGVFWYLLTLMRSEEEAKP